MTRRTPFPWSLVVTFGFALLIGMIVGAQCVLYAERDADTDCCAQYADCIEKMSALLTQCRYGAGLPSPTSERATDAP